VNGAYVSFERPHEHRSVCAEKLWFVAYHIPFLCQGSRAGGRGPQTRSQASGGGESAFAAGFNAGGAELRVEFAKLAKAKAFDASVAKLRAKLKVDRRQFIKLMLLLVACLLTGVMHSVQLCGSSVAVSSTPVPPHRPSLTSTSSPSLSLPSLAPVTRATTSWTRTRRLLLGLQ